LFLPSLNGAWNYSAYLVERPFSFPRKLDGQNIKLAHYLHLVLNLLMSGVNTYISHTPAWRGVELSIGKSEACSFSGNKKIKESRNRPSVA
jgi:hypothetical protein